MAFNRRHFLKTAGATTVALAASDLVADLIAQSPSGAPSSRSSRGCPTSPSARRSGSA